MRSIDVSAGRRSFSEDHTYRVASARLTVFVTAVPTAVRMTRDGAGKVFINTWNRSEHRRPEVLDPGCSRFLGQAPTTGKGAPMVREPRDGGGCRRADRGGRH